ncbi:hypothetical protein [Aliihoeflea sp. 2WW]|uniref:hypothetical protein n=1 Tax=Aliihoeflea sp. 2WW TaxID=1381123 RepID=UPI0004635028|nr:hypothetical protein [Aliihoeflea sp. 2WW]
MALPDILPAETFVDRLRIRSVKWHLQRFDELSGLASGDVLAAQMSMPKWTGDVSLGPMYHADAAQVQALVESLDGPMRSFYLYAPQLPYPQHDPDGSNLGVSMPTLHTIGANNKSLRVTGLPNGYRLTVGDFLAFEYGANPVRRAFHRVVETVQASSGGLTPLFEVRPHLRPGVVTGLAVALRKPAAKVFIMPDTFDPGTAEGLITAGMSFQVMQRP